MKKRFFTGTRCLAALLALALMASLPPRAGAALDLSGCPNADPAKADAYEAFRDIHSSLTIQQAVTLVNVGLDRPFYTHIQPVEQPNDRLVLVNKYHSLSSGYVPPDLTQLRYGGSGVRLRAEAAEAFDRMAAAARQAGVNIVGVSGYRSYDLQASLYSRYSAQDGTAAADRYSARPGHSEHQTGLAIDVSNGGVYTRFGGTSAHSWAVRHLHEYGFIIRYTKANEWITGYKDEAWHFRYVGVEAATEIYHLGITLEEYLDRYVSPTGASTAAAESLAGLSAQFSVTPGTYPGGVEQVCLTFSNALVPVSGTSCWTVNGITVPGSEQPCTLSNGQAAAFRFVNADPGRTCRVAFRFTGKDGSVRTWQALSPDGAHRPLLEAVAASALLPAASPHRQVWRTPGFLDL